MDRVYTSDRLRRARRDHQNRRFVRRLWALAVALAVIGCVLTWQNAQGRAQDGEVRALSRRMHVVERRTQYMQDRLGLEHPDGEVFYL